MREKNAIRFLVALTTALQPRALIAVLKQNIAILAPHSSTGITDPGHSYAATRSPSISPAGATADLLVR